MAKAETLVALKKKSHILETKKGLEFQMTKREKIKSNRGITLIALAVTIIILLILAGITINAVMGEGGLINRAKIAGQKTEEGKQNDIEAVNNLTNQAEELINGGEPKTLAGTTVEKPSGWTSTKVTPIADGNGGIVLLPSEFYYVGGNYNTGLVISDKQDDTIDASGTTMGNQFVWIPVPNEETLTRSMLADRNIIEQGLGITEANYSTELPPEIVEMTEGMSYEEFINWLNEFMLLNDGYTEPCTEGYQGEEEEYNTMRTQVLKYGGFYIGRYEAGVNSTQPRGGATVVQVVSKKGVYPYNYAIWGEAMNDIGTSGAVYLAKNMYSNHESVTSTLVYGCQWDAMCRYIGDSQRTTPNKPTLELTGSVETDVSKNIYDLAGNCSEWTMESRTRLRDRSYPARLYLRI